MWDRAHEGAAGRWCREAVVDETVVPLGAAVVEAHGGHAILGFSFIDAHAHWSGHGDRCTTPRNRVRVSRIGYETMLGEMVIGVKQGHQARPDAVRLHVFRRLLYRTLASDAAILLNFFFYVLVVPEKKRISPSRPSPPYPTHSATSSSYENGKDGAEDLK
ncbi:hypothetical protein CONPUDRAFT_74207 [Coniophora puteana RWD-64-598 SS2]|uniref:Uncharacterized protein n=1 Tax=Coniophora puteana (strain RWD-64-598) TaxID=741705 RepID=A0A5M3MMG6_CONPW|nr:uncharacterized protein CONPUDRAFT_74207 [Coniophora puteana RWD-64-598 SS2]EIW79885.1 hypothetical protein CONPUDRAFT_74207 [Coniophora puteana RWD-64-598 SS2]